MESHKRRCISFPAAAHCDLIQSAIPTWSHIEIIDPLVKHPFYIDVGIMEKGFVTLCTKVCQTTQQHIILPRTHESWIALFARICFELEHATSIQIGVPESNIEELTNNRPSTKTDAQVQTVRYIKCSTFDGHASKHDSQHQTCEIKQQIVSTWCYSITTSPPQGALQFEFDTVCNQ